ncbi:MAG: hypothetical protein KAU90_01215, partial [Sulfurovaceae bacterium]|nr:hypothetical protein [Sulfurovaceae bacterium]
LALDAEKKRLEDNSFKWRHVAYKFKGHYAEHLNILFKYFDKSQVKIIIFEEFKKNPLISISEIEEWLNVKYFEPNINKKHNVAKLPRFQILSKLRYKNNIFKSIIKKITPKKFRRNLIKKVDKYNLKDANNLKMNQEIENELYDYFKEHNIKLKKLLKKDLSIWKK